MTYFFEIVPGTEPHKIADELFNYPKGWVNSEVEKEIKALGIDVNGNLNMWPFCLEVRYVPDSLRDQFKKNRNNRGCLEAKKKSDINQAFLKIVEKYGLIYRQSSDLTFALKCGFGYVREYTRIGDRYFAETEDGLNSDGLDFLRKSEALKEVSEPEYLRIKLEYLESHEGGEPDERN